MKAAETNILRLLQGSKVFLVPNFQRRYSWRRDEWNQLWEDLLRECRREHDPDPQTLDGHFLGSVVLHPAPGGASVLMKHLIVDGQQRLTTILIIIAALRDVGSHLKVNGWNPREYDEKYLINKYDDDYPDRLVPTKLDRESYTRTVRDNTPTGGIGQAYTFFSKKIREVSTSDDPNIKVDLQDLARTLLLHLLVVEINTTPGDSVNNIFNRLNSKGMQLSAADLVRNELLLNLTEHQAETAYEAYWMPMENNLVRPMPGGRRDDRPFVTFLWAREVAHSPDTTRLNLFLAFEKRFRDELKDLPPEKRQSRSLDIFKQIHHDQALFMIFQDPLNPFHDSSSISLRMREALDRVRRWNSDPCTPLALWILTQVDNGKIEEEEAIGAIDIVLGYLVRRSLAGIPTNQLNRLLTPIPHQLQVRQGKSLIERLTEILSLPGYHWPSDSEVVVQGVRTPLFLSANRQVPFILSELEVALSSKERVSTGDLKVEHVMPQSMPADWTEYIQASGEGIDEALAALHTLGNLTLTRKDRNPDRSDFFAKKSYLSESSLHLNLEISQMESFLPADIYERSLRLLALLLDRYPGPPRPAGAFVSEDEGLFEGLEGALQTIPDASWTTDEDLVPFLGTDLNSLRALVNRLGPEVARLVRDQNGMVPAWFTDSLRNAVIAQDSDFDPRPDSRVSSTKLAELVDAIGRIDGDSDD
ncbi:DUF262 domain-containing HNH endonuclease family protein [Nocardioides sp. NPDC127514]|uniref:DUF262 domain-containing protein n=1 Tax=unclassified Nocardioides TaxID=2615069 RepID=UPI003316CD0A